MGDAAATLRRLIPLLERKTDRAWQEKVQLDVVRWWEVMDRRAKTSADPINPQQVFAELSERLPDDVIVASDSGSAANWYARHPRFRGGMRGSLSGTLATMGPGVPYVIGAKFGHPDRPAVALVGDGAMQMNGNAELVTVAKYWRQWDDPRLIVAVLNNDDLNQVRAMAGAPQLLEFLTDASVPPIPPHATWEQMENAASALLHGDSDRWGIVKEGVKTKVQEFLPGTKD